MQLGKEYDDLDIKLAKKKEELAAKIGPAILEFLEDTGIRVDFIHPTMIETTQVGDVKPNYLLGKIEIRTKR